MNSASFSLAFVSLLSVDYLLTAALLTSLHSAQELLGGWMGWVRLLEVVGCSRFLAYGRRHGLRPGCRVGAVLKSNRAAARRPPCSFRHLNCHWDAGRCGCIRPVLKGRLLLWILKEFVLFNKVVKYAFLYVYIYFLSNNFCLKKK